MTSTSRKSGGAFLGTYTQEAALTDLTTQTFTNNAGKAKFVGCNFNLTAGGASTLEISVDGGTTWKYVNQVTSGTNHGYTFVVPVGAQYRFRSATALSASTMHNSWY